MDNNKKEKAITLIALVITIVVLIILAGVAINLSLGENGLFKKAKTASEEYTNAQKTEETEIAKITNEIDEMADGIIMGGRGPVTRTVLFDTVTTATTSTPVTLNDDIKNYDYLIINIAWRYESRNTINAGAQYRQYFLDTSLIELRDDATMKLDYTFMYGYNTTTDYIGLCFVKDKKLNIFFGEILSGRTAAVTKILGIKF